MIDLQRMPLALPVSVKNGQASASIERRNDSTIVVTATCDSLQREVLILTDELTRIRNETTREEKPPDGLAWWQTFFITIGQLAVAALAIYITVRAIKR